jgi:hypothetical protein
MPVPVSAQILQIDKLAYQKNRVKLFRRAFQAFQNPWVKPFSSELFYL